jgi:hypothetical protein
MSDTVHRDERIVAVENAGYRWGYLVLTFGLLAIAAYRGFARGDSAWDLLALVVLGGAVTTAYQNYGRVLTRHWLVTVVIAIALAAIIGVLASTMGR